LIKAGRELGIILLKAIYNLGIVSSAIDKVDCILIYNGLTGILRANTLMSKVKVDWSTWSLVNVSACDEVARELSGSSHKTTVNHMSGERSLSF
jgi:hypothetical protein